MDKFQCFIEFIIITDCVGTSVTSNQILQFNGTMSKWINVNNPFIFKTNTNVTTNQQLLTTYTDGTDGYNITNAIQPNATIAITSFEIRNNSVAYSIVNGTLKNIMGGDDLTGAGYQRYNCNLGVAYTVTQISMGCFYTVTGTVNVYGSNSTTDFNDITNNTTNLTFLYSFSPVQQTQSIYNFTNSNSFQYYCVIVTTTSGNWNMYGFYIGFSATNPVVTLVQNTDFTVSSSSSTGAPVITYTDSTILTTMTYNENLLLLSESYRRIYPVVRDKNTIK